MKPVFISLVLTVLALSGFSQTETASLKPAKLSKNHFYLSPFNLIVGQFQIAYERDFGKRSGLLLQFSGILPGNRNDYSYVTPYDSKEYGYTAEVQYRHRIVSVSNPRQKAKNPFRFDFYIAPFAAYQELQFYSEYSSPDFHGNYNTYYSKEFSQSVSTGVLFGTRFTFFERFTLDAYFGGGLKFSPHGSSNYYSYDYDIFKPNHTGVIGKVNLQFGVAF